ncbi:hypothetical protein WISP_75283 [Willisornis vidua]|uniref:Uncharacterized protein n=1 Tax=Willisornis vidua TaxID=1566151 RepID=A0ABQ9DAW5_9PASS|nr:hypothetical protein WISP_75283 [Willisornis vidua]
MDMIQEGSLEGAGTGWPSVPKGKPMGKKISLVEQGDSEGNQLKKESLQSAEKRAATNEEFRNIVRLCRKKIRETKAQFDMNLATSVRDNKKSFYKYINNKKGGKENLHSLLDLRGNIVNRDEKAEVRKTYFASVFTSKTGGPQDNWPLELVERDRELNRPPVFQEEILSDILNHLDPHKSMGQEGIHPRVMREMVEELAKLLFIIYYQSQFSGEVPDDCKLANVTSPQSTKRAASRTLATTGLSA